MRDLDVKYRTQELASSTYAWREGLAEWQPLFSIDEIKQVLQASNDEVNDPNVRKVLDASRPKNEKNDDEGPSAADAT